MVFRGNYGSIYEWTYLSFQFQMNKNEIEMCEFEMYLENFLFCFRSKGTRPNIGRQPDHGKRTRLIFRLIGIGTYL